MIDAEVGGVSLLKGRALAVFAIAEQLARPDHQGDRLDLLLADDIHARQTPGRSGAISNDSPTTGKAPISSFYRGATFRAALAPRQARSDRRRRKDRLAPNLDFNVHLVSGQRFRVDFDPEPGCLRYDDLAIGVGRDVVQRQVARQGLELRGYSQMRWSGETGEGLKRGAQRKVGCEGVVGRKPRRASPPDPQPAWLARGRRCGPQSI